MPAQTEKNLSYAVATLVHILSAQRFKISSQLTESASPPKGLDAAEQIAPDSLIVCYWHPYSRHVDTEIIDTTIPVIKV